MVLSDDVVSVSGQLLVAKGIELSESIINYLKRQGIYTIYVATEDKEESFSAGDIQKAEEMCKERVRARFHQDASDPMMKLLFETALRIEALQYLKCQSKV
jgi:hypothetical protein